MKSKAPICPICGIVATKTETKWGVKYIHCGLWAWGRHPLADAKTHAARQKAHSIFDPLWKSGFLRRGDAYHLLADELKLPERECHMKLMSEAVAKRVPDAVFAIRGKIGRGEVDT